MSEAKKRKVHTPEFKAKVGLEALRGVKTINELGQEYGVHPVQVGQWKKEISGVLARRFHKPFPTVYGAVPRTSMPAAALDVPARLNSSDGEDVT